MEWFKNSLVRQGEQIATTQMAGTAENTPVGAPEVYGGSPDTLNPEEMFVASINSCIMLVFYHFANQHKVNIASYQSEAQGKVEKTKQGLRFTEVQVTATVSPRDAQQSDEIAKLGQLAEKYCLVSNSMTCPVHYHIRVADTTGPLTKE
ncbi:MAG: OsmC family protein [Phycisphaerae bacterium]|nr:OsmC family protein [Phycisphaerae bacterium]